MTVVPLTEVRHQALNDDLNRPPLSGQSRLTLVAAVMGFFVVTLDAVVVNVALPSIRHAFPEGPDRARAVALWAIGGVAASTSGPLLGGLLTLVSWRLIFFVNLPVGAAAVVLAARMTRSPLGRAS